MTDFDAARVLGHVIHDALDPKANDYQREARAVIAAIQADSQVGAKLRKAIVGISPAPALWDRLDETAPVSAQMIQWEAPHTAELIHSSHVAAHARQMAEAVKDPDEIALWTAIALELEESSGGSS